MAGADSDTDQTGWAEAEVPMNWSDEHPAEPGEWTECDPPTDDNDSPDLDEGKIAEAKKQAAEINELLGF